MFPAMPKRSLRGRFYRPLLFVMSVTHRTLSTGLAELFCIHAAQLKQAPSKEVCMEYDPDDPPPADDYWGFLNRWAEECMRYARLFGFI
jgi:hypothetical protein